MLFLFWTAVAWAGDPMVCRGTPGEKTWDRRCTELSSKAAEHPGELGRPVCAKHIPMRKDLNTRCAWYPVEARHVPGLIAEAFHSRNREDRSSALNYLEEACRHEALCYPFRETMDREVKANILAWRKSLPDLAKRAEALRDLAFRAPTRAE